MFSSDFARFFYRGLRTIQTGIVLYKRRYIHNTPCTYSKLKSLSEKTRELERRYIYVRSCVDFWVDLPIGVMFDTAYLDSKAGHYGDNTDTPVLLGLHDSPGSSLDLITLLQPFVNIGYRVIIPDFPGYGSTKGMGKFDNITFTGGTDERIDFLHNFLHNLGIEKVDLLVGHGSGCNSAVCYTAATLQKENTIKSIALINPIGHRPSSVTDYNKIKEFAKLWDEKPFFKIPLAMALMQTTYTTLPFLKKYTFKDRIKVMQHLAGFQYDLIGSCTATLSCINIPKLMVYSQDQGSAYEEIMKEYANHFGIPASNFGVIENDGKIQQPKTNNPALKGIVVKEGPDIIQKYSGTLTVLLNDILNHSLKKKSIVS